jgi:hypothetical protein
MVEQIEMNRLFRGRVESQRVMATRPKESTPATALRLCGYAETGDDSEVASTRACHILEMVLVWRKFQMCRLRDKQCRQRLLQRSAVLHRFRHR